MIEKYAPSVKASPAILHFIHSCHSSATAASFYKRKQPLYPQYQNVPSIQKLFYPLFSIFPFQQFIQGLWVLSIQTHHRQVDALLLHHLRQHLHQYTTFRHTADIPEQLW